jgi:hypothetical protein
MLKVPWGAGDQWNTEPLTIMTSLEPEADPWTPEVGLWNTEVNPSNKELGQWNQEMDLSIDPYKDSEEEP